MGPHSRAYGGRVSGSHDHAGSSATSPAARRRALTIAIGANGALLVVQLVAAVAFGSLALIADTVHLATDVVALLLALGAQILATRPASARTTYGWDRAEVLAGLINAFLLIAASVWIAVEAIGRFSDPHDVDGLGVAIVGGLGLAVNAGSALVVARATGSNLNLRGAFLHLAADAVGSLGVLVAGVLVFTSHADWADPAISLFITVLVLVAAWSLLRDATGVLLEQAPRGMDAAAIEAALVEVDDVQAVHHVHVWSLGSETPAISAHVVLRDEPSLHDAQLVGNQLRTLLVERFGLEHATLELECHDCAQSVHGSAAAVAPDSHS